VFDLEREANEEGKVKFVLFADPSGSWRVSTMPPKSDSFDMRVPLHQKWRGLRDSELAEVSGVKDAVFVHMTGFIGGAQSYDSALKMATDSLAAFNGNPE
jgi:uncharacterized UPF0160 family protein